MTILDQYKEIKATLEALGYEGVKFLDANGNDINIEIKRKEEIK